MHVTSPEDRAIAWRTALSRRGEEREALRHLLVSEMLVELRSDLDLYGNYGDAFVDSVDLLDRYDRFFDHPMLMAYQALGVETDADDEHEDSRRLLAAVATRLGEVASSDDIDGADRHRSGDLAELWPGGSYRIPAGQFRSSASLLRQRAGTRHKLRDLQRGRSLSDQEIVVALRESRRDDGSR